MKTDTIYWLLFICIYTGGYIAAMIGLWWSLIPIVLTAIISAILHRAYDIQFKKELKDVK